MPHLQSAMPAKGPSQARNVVADALQLRVHNAGAGPLLTWYRDDARVELSVRTFANWVDKATNLLTDLGFIEQPRVWLDLLRTDRLHWQTLVWAWASWQLGGTIVLQDDEVAPMNDTHVAVVGPNRLQDGKLARPIAAEQTIVCALQPLGLGFPQRPTGVIDGAEVLSQPDVHWSAPPSSPAQSCFQVESTQRTELSWAALDELQPDDRRLLVHDELLDTDPFTVPAALLRASRGAGSLVLLDGSVDAARIDQLLDQERAEIADFNRS